jgi:shikimate dehydrogenase
MTDKLSLALDGATRVHYIVGDPIAQVKSPAGVSLALQARGQHALVVPAHVAPADLAEWVRGVSLARNVDGLIVTVPHKFACFDLCASHSDRAAFLHTVNVMRRRPDGGWHGDMFDGQGFVAAMQQRGGQPAAARPCWWVRAAPARRSRTRCCWPG